MRVEGLRDDAAARGRERREPAQQPTGTRWRSQQAEVLAERDDRVERAELVGSDSSAIARTSCAPADVSIPNTSSPRPCTCEESRRGARVAAKSDRVGSRSSWSRGARVDVERYRGGALAWAAVDGRVAAIERLLALGAGPNARGTFGGPTHGDGRARSTSPRRAASAGAVRTLLAAGADPALRDPLHGGAPAGWAEFGRRRDVAALLREAGSAAPSPAGRAQPRRRRRCASLRVRLPQSRR